MSDLSQSQLRALLSYDPLTGEFVWLPRTVTHYAHQTWNTRFAGKPAGTPTPDGLQIRIESKSYRANRLVWLYMTGAWPSDLVDHIDGNPLNDRWINLRAASQIQNSWNRKLTCNNKSGYPGVRRPKWGKKWIAEIRHKGVHCHLGLYDTFEEAKVARCAAEQPRGQWVRGGI